MALKLFNLIFEGLTLNFGFKAELMKNFLFEIFYKSVYYFMGFAVFENLMSFTFEVKALAITLRIYVFLVFYQMFIIVFYADNLQCLLMSFDS